MRKLITLALISTIATGLVAPPASAGDLDLFLTEWASTPAQHEAVGKYFDRKAAEARTQAARHHAMGVAYSGGKLVEIARMRAHCDKLAAAFEEQAKQYDAMAAIQRHPPGQ